MKYHCSTRPEKIHETLCPAESSLDTIEPFHKTSNRKNLIITLLIKLEKKVKKLKKILSIVQIAIRFFKFRTNKKIVKINVCCLLLLPDQAKD